MKVLLHLGKTPMFLSEWYSCTSRREKFVWPYLPLAYYKTWQRKCHSENYRVLIRIWHTLYLDMIHKDHGEVKKKERTSLKSPRLVQVRLMYFSVYYVEYWLLCCCLFKSRNIKFERSIHYFYGRQGADTLQWRIQGKDFRLHEPLHLS